MTAFTEKGAFSPYIPTSSRINAVGLWPVGNGRYHTQDCWNPGQGAPPHNGRFASDYASKKCCCAIRISSIRSPLLCGDLLFEPREVVVQCRIVRRFP